MAEWRKQLSSNSSHSQISESLQTVEESLLVGEKSSPVVLGRQESVFLAESSASTSVEDQENSGNSKAFSQRFVFGSCETIQSESVAESEILTEEGDYPDEFESAGSSEWEFSTKVETWRAYIIFGCMNVQLGYSPSLLSRDGHDRLDIA